MIWCEYIFTVYNNKSLADTHTSLIYPVLFNQLDWATRKRRGEEEQYNWLTNYRLPRWAGTLTSARLMRSCSAWGRTVPLIHLLLKSSCFFFEMLHTTLKNNYCSRYLQCWQSSAADFLLSLHVSKSSPHSEDSLPCSCVFRKFNQSSYYALPSSWCLDLPGFRVHSI